MINFFACLVTFGFLLGNFGRIRISEVITFSILDISVVICLLAFWIGKGVVYKKIEQKILPAFGIFSFVCIASLLLNILSYTPGQLLVAFLYLIRWVIYASIFFIVLSLNPGDKKILYKYVLFAGSAIVCIGFVQYFFYPNLRNLYYLGWDDHLYRMFSSFFDPNFAGILFVLYLLYLSGNVLFGFKKKKIDFLKIGLSAFTLFAVFLTYSRTAIVMLSVSICSLLWFLGYKKFIPILLLILLTILIFISNTNIEGTNPFRITSSEARIISAREAPSIFARHPVFGIGFNAYRYALEKAGFRAEGKIVPSNADAGADNSFLFILATTGIVGLTSYLYLWKKILSFVNINNQNPHRAIVLSSILGLLVSSIFINSLFYPFILLWMWVLIGLTENS